MLHKNMVLENHAKRSKMALWSPCGPLLVQPCCTMNTCTCTIRVHVSQYFNSLVFLLTTGTLKMFVLPLYRLLFFLRARWNCATLRFLINWAFSQTKVFLTDTCPLTCITHTNSLLHLQHLTRKPHKVFNELINNKYIFVSRIWK